MLNLKKILPIFLFWVLIATTLVLTMMPAEVIPNALNFWDKMQHALCFATLTFVGMYAYSHKPKQLTVALCIYGGLIELMQTFLTSTRHGDWHDWLADSIGIVVGFCLFLLIQKYVRI